MSSAAELFGYENYAASPLEYTDLYTAKSGPEIVSECYNLVDKGGRSVTLRPEMTPTLARMIAAQERELPRPIRFYSIPNVFRYEKPQKGRLREHYQFNADIFGVAGIEAEIEIIELGMKVCENMGLLQKDFIVKINNRKILNSIFKDFTSEQEKVYKISKLIDKKNKISKDDFRVGIEEFLKEKTESFINILNSSSLFELKEKIPEDVFRNTMDLIEKLQKKGFTNIEFDLTLMRGFDYYTDMVFEFFDTHPENNRSMFGGGRYDDLLTIFGKERVPAVGFGMGDVTARDSLQIRDLMPEIKSKTKVSLLPFEKEFFKTTEDLADFLRKNNVNTEVDYSEKNLTKKIKSVEKKDVEFFIVVGENEKSTGKFCLKNILTGDRFEDLKKENVFDILKN
jgi:histidyl-tRNA synthetase